MAGDTISNSMKLRRMVQMLQADKKELTRELGKVSSELAQQHSIAVTAKAGSESAQAAAEGIRQERDLATAKVQSLQKQIKALDDDRNSTHARLQAQLLTLESAVRGARDKFESQRAALLARAESAEGEAASAVQAAAQAAEAAATREDALRSENKQLRNALGTARAAQRSAVADLTDERIMKLQQQMEAAQSSAAAEHRATVARLTSALQSKAAALAEADEEARGLRHSAGSQRLAAVLGTVLRRNARHRQRCALEHWARHAGLTRQQMREALASSGTREAQLQHQLASLSEKTAKAVAAQAAAAADHMQATKDAAALSKQVKQLQEQSQGEISALQSQLEATAATSESHQVEAARLQSQLEAASAPQWTEPSSSSDSEALPLMARMHGLQARLQHEARATTRLTEAFEDVRESLDTESGRSAAMEAMLLMLKLHMTGQQCVEHPASEDDQPEHAAAEGVAFQDPPPVTQAAVALLSSTHGSAASPKAFDSFITALGTAARKHLVAHTEQQRRQSSASVADTPPPDASAGGGRRLSRANSAAGPEAEQVATAAGVPRRRKSVVSTATPGVSAAARTLAALAAAAGKPLESLAHTSLSKALQATASQLQAERTLSALLAERILHFRCRTAAVRARVEQLVPGAQNAAGAHSAAVAVAEDAIQAATAAVTTVMTASSSSTTAATAEVPTGSRATTSTATSSTASTTTMSSASSTADSSDSDDDGSQAPTATSPKHEALSPEVLLDLQALEETVTAALAHMHSQHHSTGTAKQQGDLADVRGELAALLCNAALSDAARGQALAAQEQAGEAMHAAALAVKEMEHTKNVFGQAHEHHAETQEHIQQQWVELFGVLGDCGVCKSPPAFDEGGVLDAECLTVAKNGIQNLKRGGFITPPSSPSTPPRGEGDERHELPPGTPQRVAAALAEAEADAAAEPFQGPAHAVAQFACIAHALTSLSDAMHEHARGVFSAPEVPSPAALAALALLPDAPETGACGMCSDAVRYIYNASAHVVEALAESHSKAGGAHVKGGSPAQLPASVSPTHDTNDGASNGGNGAPALARLNALLSAAGSALGVARADMGGAKDEVARRAEETANLRSQIEYLDMRDMRQGAVRAQLEARLAEAHARVRALGSIAGGMVRLLAPAVLPEERLRALWTAAVAYTDQGPQVDRMAANGGPSVAAAPGGVTGVAAQLAPGPPPCAPPQARERFASAAQDAGVSFSALEALLTDALQPPLPTPGADLAAQARLKAQVSAGSGHAGGMTASAAAARQALIAFLRQVAHDDERDTHDGSADLAITLQVRAAELAEAAAAAQGAAAAAAARAEELERDLGYSRSEVVRLSEEVCDKVQEVNAVHDQLRCVEDDLAVQSADAVMLRLQLQMAEGASAAEVAAAAAAAVESEVHGRALPPTPVTPAPPRTPMRGGSLDDTPRKVSWRGALTDERTIEARADDSPQAGSGDEGVPDADVSPPPRAPLPPPLYEPEESMGHAYGHEAYSEYASPPPTVAGAGGLAPPSTTWSLRDIAEKRDDLHTDSRADGSNNSPHSPPLQWHSPEHPPTRGLHRSAAPPALGSDSPPQESPPHGRTTPPRPQAPPLASPADAAVQSHFQQSTASSTSSSSQRSQSPPSRAARHGSNGSDDVGGPQTPPSPEPMGGLSSPAATAMVRAKRKGGKGGSKKGPGTEGGKLLWDMLEEGGGAQPGSPPARFQPRSRLARPPSAAVAGVLQQQLEGGSDGHGGEGAGGTPSAASLEAALTALGLDGDTEASVRQHLQSMAAAGEGSRQAPWSAEGKAEPPTSHRPSWK